MSDAQKKLSEALRTGGAVCGDDRSRTMLEVRFFDGAGDDKLYWHGQVLPVGKNKYLRDGDPSHRVQGPAETAACMRDDARKAFSDARLGRRQIGEYLVAHKLGCATTPRQAYVVVGIDSSTYEVTLRRAPEMDERCE